MIVRVIHELIYGDILMALQFVTSQIKDSAITNAKLAGSIADSKLNQITTADKVAGSALQLAGSGGLENDSGIKISAGGVTNAMLAGSIANAKLSNSSVTVAGNAIALGSSLAAATLAGSMALSDIAVPTASVAMNSQKITGLLDPTSAQDAATKAYVDASSQGLDVKDSVKAASTANLTLSGTQTVDGVSMLADDRILVKDQSSGVENGIYIVAAGSWSRASDFAAGDDEAGAFCFVEQGTVNADNGFVCTNNKGSAVVGTDALSFTQFSGAGQIVAGDGLAKSGNTLSVNVDDSSLEIDSDALRVKALGITNAMLAGSIDQAKLAGSIPDSKLNQLTSADKVAGSAVQLSANTALEDDSGLALKDNIAGDGLLIAESGGDQILSIDVADGVKIQGGKLEAELDGSTLSISASGIKVANLGIANAQISNSAGIAFTKLEALSSANILVGNAGNQAASVSMSGDVAISNTGSTTIQNNAISNAKIADSAVTLAKLGLTGKFETTAVANSSTSSIPLASRIADADFRHGAFVQVFRNGQRLEYKASGKSDNTQYDIVDNGSQTSVGFGANLEDGDVIFISYMI